METVTSNVLSEGREGRGAVGAFVAAVCVVILVCPTAAIAQQSEQSSSTEIHEHLAVTAPRETSGTAWLPAVTPMYGLHRPWRDWDIRVSGAAFVQGLYELPRALAPRYSGRAAPSFGVFFSLSGATHEM